MMTKDDIFKLIDEEDVEFIRLQFTDMFGSLKNLAVTPSQMEKVIAGKVSFEGDTLFGNNGVFSDDLYLKPDLDTFVILPWRPQQGKVAKLICDVVDEDGKPFELDPRQILKNTIKKLRDKGYVPMVYPECEFFLFHTTEDGVPTTVTHEHAGTMDVGPVDLGENARRDMVLTLEEMGFEVESSHHEKAPGQHEIDFSGAEAMKIADSIVTFKFAVRSIAKRFGLHATFMPKPIANAEGSGMHLKIALYKNGVNAFAAENKKSVPDAARYFMGGVMEHVKGFVAVTNPTVNSYKRIRSGMQAPVRVDWATKGEDAMIVYKNRGTDSKVELRFPDPSANPYLALAVCLAAGLDGIENARECGADSFEYPNIDVPMLPGSLNEAVKKIEYDHFAKEVLGNEFVKIYTDEKKKEWNDYMQSVSEWEISHYLVKM